VRAALRVDQPLDHALHLPPPLLEGRGIDFDAEEGAENAQDPRGALRVHEVPARLAHQADPLYPAREAKAEQEPRRPDYPAAGLVGIDDCACSLEFFPEVRPVDCTEHAGDVDEVADAVSPQGVDPLHPQFPGGGDAGVGEQVMALAGRALEVPDEEEEGPPPFPA